METFYIQLKADRFECMRIKADNYEVHYEEGFYKEYRFYSNGDIIVTIPASMVIGIK